MLYDELSAVENLRYFAGLYRSCRCLTPAEALLAVGLDPRAYPALSASTRRGMRQRTSLARVLLPSNLHFCCWTSPSPTWMPRARAR